MTARQRRLSFASRRHLSVPDPRAAMSSLELGSSQEEGPPTPSILVLSPQLATASDGGHFQFAGDKRRRPAKSTKIGRQKGTKLSGQ